MRTLVIIRHAKADSPSGVDDIDRPLLARGRADARAAGTWLRKAGITVDLIVASPSTRTTQTVDGLLLALADVAMVVDEQIYEASLGDLLHVLRGLDDDAPTTALVGHNPGMSELAMELTGDPLVLSTAAVLVVDMPADSWADVAAGTGVVRASAVPRG